MYKDLITQILELFSLLRNLAQNSFKFLTGMVNLFISFGIFILTCGSLVHLRQPRTRRVTSSNTFTLSERTQTTDAYSTQGSRSMRSNFDGYDYYKVPYAKSREKLKSMLQQQYSVSQSTCPMPDKCRQDWIFIPSLSLDNQELSKIPGVSFYEERQLCTLLYLRNPNLRLVYITSLPVSECIIEYYIELITKVSNVTKEDIYSRLLLLSCHDTSNIPLTAKIHRRPKIIDKIRSWIHPNYAHITCFISSNLERELAIKIGVPLLSNDPSLSFWGTKFGSREAFKYAGVSFARGSGLVYSSDELVNAIYILYKFSPYPIKRAVIKLNIGFSGEGNALLDASYFQEDDLKFSIKKAIQDNLSFVCKEESWSSFQIKLKIHGAIVEEWIENVEDSPSCQAFINQSGGVEILSTHAQVLDNMVYLGCMFPCRNDYRVILQDMTYKIGKVLACNGCRDRFAVDFVARYEGNLWKIYAIEINLRWGGTAHPFIYTSLMTDGEFTPDGLLLGKDGLYKYYIATDNIRDSIYSGLTPTDFLEIVYAHSSLQFDTKSYTGPIFYLLSALSLYGKFGFVCIGNSPDEAKRKFNEVLKILEEEVKSITASKKFTELDLSITPPYRIRNS
jgi:hypothetical protein